MMAVASGKALVLLATIAIRSVVVDATDSLRLISDEQLASSIETLLDDRTELILAELQNLHEKNARLERKLQVLEAREPERSAVVEEATADPQVPLDQQTSPPLQPRRASDDGWTGDGWSGDGAP